jgi:hypothetical protein
MMGDVSFPDASDDFQPQNQAACSIPVRRVGHIATSNAGYS